MDIDFEPIFNDVIFIFDNILKNIMKMIMQNFGNFMIFLIE